MKKRSINKAKVNEVRNTGHLTIAAVSSLVLAVVLGFWVLTWQLNQANITLKRYRATTGSSNIACKGLKEGYEVSKLEVGFNVSERESAAHIANFYCFTDILVPEMVIHGKTMPEYKMGAKVWYFDTDEHAKEFGERVLNPLRFWGIDQAGQAAGIPQSSLFTFVVTDEMPDAPFFDSYTVRGNTAVRISLPCAHAPLDDPTKRSDDCLNKAETMIEELALRASSNYPF